MATKYHGEIMITRDYLQEMKACIDSINAVCGLLPVTLSTDPEDNLEVAETLIEDVERMDRLWFLRRTGCWKCTCREVPLPAVDFADLNDPYVVAQFLAHYADRVLTKEGK